MMTLNEIIGFISPELANEILDDVRQNLETLSALDFSNIVDFSGHPKAATLERVIVRGLVGRTKEIRRLLR